MSPASRRWRRPAGEDGYTMVFVLGILAVVTALSAAAFANATGDIVPRKQSNERKSAYAAAEAGINFYLSRLNQDSDYWTKCDTGPAPNATEANPVVQPYTGTGTDPRVGRTRVVPGDSSRYVVELLPVAPATRCAVSTGTTATNASTSSMIEQGTGQMRVRATGYAGCQKLTPVMDCDVKRSVIASMRRKSFLDFIYFTDYETLDPAAYGQYASQAEAGCHFYRANRNQYCQEINFAANDRINGPFHTNDDIKTCGSPTFGRTQADRVEISGPAPGYSTLGSCSSTSPNFAGTLQTGASQLAVPTSNAKITQEAQAGYTFTGRWYFKFQNDGTFQYSQDPTSGYQTKAYPSNGVIWVKSNGCVPTSSTPPYQRYLESATTGCATAYVQGTYNKSVTVVSDRDIIVSDDLRQSGDSLMGLIASNYVRVYHPVTFNTSGAKDAYGNYTDCTNVNGFQGKILTNVTIEAAILSLDHSFIVDNWQCGAALQTLTVTGAIAQRYRGPVGTGNGASATTGYTKNYTYDDRFRYRNPPYFLDPVQAGWRVLKLNEQVPAR